MPGSLTAADFLSLRLQYKNTREEGEWTAVIEHDFADGRMVDHYFVRPAPSLAEDEAVQALGPVSGLLFLQQPDGAPWQVLLHETAMIREVCFEMSDGEFRRLLAANDVILPGETGLSDAVKTPYVRAGAPPAAARPFSRSLLPPVHQAADRLIVLDPAVRARSGVRRIALHDAGAAALQEGFRRFLARGRRAAQRFVIAGRVRRRGAQRIGRGRAQVGGVESGILPVLHQDRLLLLRRIRTILCRRAGAIPCRGAPKN